MTHTGTHGAYRKKIDMEGEEVNGDLKGGFIKYFIIKLISAKAKARISVRRVVNIKNKYILLNDY